METHLIQGSESWKSWRRERVTSVDASTIVKGSPSSLLKLWEEKMGIGGASFETPAMSHGKAMEPIARQWFSSYVGVVVWPDCRVSKDYPFLASSLDGISLNDDLIYEVKCPTTRRVLELAKYGNYDFDHYCQCQHHMLVTGLPVIYYHIFYSEDDSYVYGIERDDAWVQDYLPKARAFWECIKSKTPPIEERTDEKFTFFEDELVPLLEQEAALKEKLKDIEAKKKAVYQSLSFYTEGLTAMGKKILFRKMKRKGSVNYDAIPELEGVDLEEYRKDDVIYWQASIR